ncbi:MAG: L-threonylcarbamoyladenylate synthase [Candidatus Hadarchaeales archaeon]
MVRIIAIDGKVEEAISKATTTLRNGGLIIYPTETVYGLGGDARSDSVVERVIRAKMRKPDSPISIAVSSISMMKEFAHLTLAAERLTRFMPGPITLVMKAKRGVSKLLLSRDGKVGVRIPDHPFVLKLIDAAGFPITCTSANISGRRPPLTVEEAIKQIGPWVDLALDGGRCAYGTPSTVVDVVEKPFKILREGPIKRADLESAFKST